MDDNKKILRDEILALMKQNVFLEIFNYLFIFGSLIALSIIVLNRVFRYQTPTVLLFGAIIGIQYIVYRLITYNNKKLIAKRLNELSAYGDPEEYLFGDDDDDE